MLSSLSNLDPKPSDEGNVIDIDVALVREVLKNRDRSAFTRLMTKHKNTVYAFCYRYTGNRQDAEDVAQEVFIRVYKNIGTFRSESKFSSWLYRITVNTCHNYVRWHKRSRTPGIETDASNEQGALMVEGGAADPEQLLLNKELGFIIRRAVAQLKGKQRSVVILKDFLGKSYEEIASIMNISIGTVKSTLSRGRLRAALQIKEYDRL